MLHLNPLLLRRGGERRLLLCLNPHRFRGERRLSLHLNPHRFGGERRLLLRLNPHRFVGERRYPPPLTPQTPANCSKDCHCVPSSNVVCITFTYRHSVSVSSDADLHH